MSSGPNILWIMTDEHRTDSLGCYGSSWARTPNIDRIADDGVVFENAITPAPICLPSRTSLLTGRYPHDTGVWCNGSGLPKQTPPLTRAFESAGYRTASFGKQHYLASDVAAFQTEHSKVLAEEVGYYDYHVNIDFDDYGVVKYPTDPCKWIFAGKFPASPEQTPEAQAIERAKEWLIGCEPDKPFLLRVSLNAPHTPVVPPEPFYSLIDPDDITLPGIPDKLPDYAPEWLTRHWRMARSDRMSVDDIAAMRSAYYGEVSFVDSLVGGLIDWMEGEQLLTNTIVVFCSDHGTHLGDYGLVQKETFFDPVVRVPYIFWSPLLGSDARRIDVPVESRTLLPTLAELAGIELLDPEKYWSLAECVGGGEPVESRPVFSEFSLGSFGLGEERLVMVRDGRWKLSLRVDPEPTDVVLTDLIRDPDERHDASNSVVGRFKVEEMIKVALDHLESGK